MNTLLLGKQIFTASMFLLLSAPSFACRCVEPEPAAPAYRNAAAVVVGTVVSIRQDSQKTAIATVRVSQRWKQDVPDEVEVATVATTCAFDFEQGKQYLMYLRVPPNGGYSTARCRGNMVVENAAKPLAWLKRNAKLKAGGVRP